MGMIFKAAFSAIAVSLAQDLWEVVAPAASRVRIREIRFGQYSDFGDAQAEIISVLILRGYTVAGSGGGTITPAGAAGSIFTGAAASTVLRNNTTVASGGSPVTLLADCMNVAAGFLYRPPLEEMDWLEAAERYVVRITAPADPITMNGMLVLEEMGIVSPGFIDRSGGR